MTIHDMLRKFSEQGGAILLVMSDFAELLSLASRVLVLRDGQLVKELPGSCDEELLIRLATGVEPDDGGLALKREAENVS
jgi:ribose transport system ATP-binding protein